MNEKQSSLFTRIGGEDTIELMVNKLFQTITSDPEFGPYFENTTIKKHKQTFQMFVTVV
ncbi:hypothetical protein BC833DRAFT_613281, partial [Globomyces pollinis-pini]